MTKITQVLLQSNHAISGSTNNNAFFNVDWNCILKPNTPYHVSFTYGGGLNVNNGKRPCLVRINFNMLNYAATANSDCVSTNILGILKPQPLLFAQLTSYMNAVSTDNNACYMERRPLNNTFNLQLTEVDGALYLDDVLNFPSNWTIFLYFREATNKIPNKQLFFSNLSGIDSIGALGTPNRTDRTYYVDMKYLLDKTKTYSVSFSFFAGKINTSPYRPIMVSITLGGHMYIAGENTSSKSHIIGTLNRVRFTTSINSCYNLAGVYDNAPVLLDAAKGGFLQLQFLDADFTVIPTNVFGSQDWALILNFQEL